MLTLAIACVCAAMAAGAISAWASQLRAGVQRPELAVRTGVRGLTASSRALAPGDVRERTVTLVNTGANRMRTLAATVHGGPSALTDGGLQLRIDSCAAGWTVLRGTLACRAGQRAVIGWRALGSQPMPLDAHRGLAAGARLQLRISLRLPASAGRALAGRATSLDWTFSGA